MKQGKAVIDRVTAFVSMQAPLRSQADRISAAATDGNGFGVGGTSVRIVKRDSRRNA